MDEHMITTKDNPFNPFTEFDEWRVWDEQAGYNTLSYLGRVVVTSDELSETDQSLAIEQAMDDIVANNGDFYVKVQPPTDQSAA